MTKPVELIQRFADARAVVCSALEELRFPERVWPSEAAVRHRVLQNPGAYSGPWGDSPHDMRFLNRAMDALAAFSPYAEVAEMGPAQTGKSEIGNNWQLHTILFDPADTIFVMPDKLSIRTYVTTQFTRMLDAQPMLRARQLGGPSADNIELKQFRGCDFHFLHPSGPTFRARPIPRGRLDDYDDFDMDIGDQGDAWSLLDGRMASFDAFGGTRKYVNSTPKLGTKAGIEALVAEGTDERPWVDCLMCGSPFLFDTEARLSFDRLGTPEDAEATAEVVCPECGGAHVQADKRRLMATGRWVGRGQRAVPGGDAAPMTDPMRISQRWDGRDERSPGGGVEGDLVPSKRLSQRLDGLMGMRTWGTIARLWRTAEKAFDDRQDEEPLKTFYQTVIGRNYAPRGQGEPPASEDELRSRARVSGYELGEVPAGAVCLIASIDQQVNRFEVAVWAFGAGFRAWLVDRYSISVVVEDGRERKLRPFSRAEDWSVLHTRVLSATYPMAGAPHLRMKIFNTIVDTGGLENATDNAFAWWHAMVAGDVGSGRAPVPPTAITLVKGGNRIDGKLLPPPTIDARRQIKGAPQAELYVPCVHRFKDIADVRLKRSDGGPGSIAFPSTVDDKGALVVDPYITEMRAEYQMGGVWVRDPHKANETWDLYIYAYVVIVRFGGSDASLNWVPDWARPPRGAPTPAVASSSTGVEETADVRVEPAPIVPVRAVARPMARPRRGIRVVRG